MSNQPSTKRGSWWDHETDRSKTAELSTAFVALQRQQHAAGWRRNGLIVFAAVGVVAAVKLLLSA